ncbi:MAG: rod shape-determining protein MreC [Bdellovibrionales bacterium CG10_big_fil_rev_8_21_14_0_10_45_34]|nr:MAG: rod shape-determining protein MreC [Bdellovibrionales bacterium CG10_big_fil_rev_8_21_14_0_10_45_34]
MVRFDIRKILLIGIVIALPLVSINLQREKGETLWFLVPFKVAGTEIQDLFASFRLMVQETARTYVHLIEIKKENRALSEEVNELRARLTDYEEVSRKSERLEHMLGFRAQTKADLLVAKIIGIDLFSQAQSTLRIGRGETDGVRKGQAVISPYGVVGTVVEATGNSATVLLLTDRYSVIDARVQRSRARGIIEGRSSSEGCILKYLQRTDDVRVGDLIITSGLDQIFPMGYPIGLVTSVSKRAYGITQKVEVQPIVDPSRLEEIFVLRDLKNADLFAVNSKVKIPFALTELNRHPSAESRPLESPVVTKE